MTPIPKDEAGEPSSAAGATHTNRNLIAAANRGCCVGRVAELLSLALGAGVGCGCTVAAESMWWGCMHVR